MMRKPADLYTWRDKMKKANLKINIEHKIKFCAFFAIIGVGIVFLACAQPPTEEMNRAIQALDRAENDAGALLYAPNYLSRARDALNRMQEEANSKRFDSARNYAEDVIANAERAVREGGIAASRAGDEAQNFLNGLRSPLTETESNLDTARQVENIQLDFDPLDDLLETAKNGYESAQQSLSEGDYPDALDKGQVVRSILSDINNQVSQAAMAVSQKN